MDERMLDALTTQRPDIHRRWETLLRVEPVNSPLGDPESLKHMIDYTLDTLFAALKTQKPHRSHSSCAAKRALCKCGRNPLLAYFIAGEQALLETLILAQTTRPDSSENRAAEALELKESLAYVAHREIETFCALCQIREPAASAVFQIPAPGTTAQN